MDDNFDLTNAVEIAKSEDIQPRADCVKNIIARQGEKMSFTLLQKIANLKPVDIYLAVLSEEQFLIVRDSEDYYGDFLIKLNSFFENHYQS